MVRPSSVEEEMCVGIIVTVSSFGKDVASLRTKRDTSTKVQHVCPSTSVAVHPLTSNNRNAIRTLALNYNNAHARMYMAKPLRGPILYDCNVLSTNGATIVRVSKTTKVALLSRARQGPLCAAACKIKRIVESTVSENYERFVVKVNKDTAGSKKVNVLRTLKFSLLSRRKIPMHRNTLNLGSLTMVSSSRTLPRLGRYAFQVTYSIAGPLYNSRKYDTIFNPRGNTSPTVVRRVSR